jgi:SAM-dependent methyltransferase
MAELMSSRAADRVATPRWDYTALAAHYDRRPDYDGEFVARILAGFSLDARSIVLDVGAGTGKLTGLLCASGAQVVACEPNAAMRGFGVRKPDCRAASWIGGDGDALPVRAASVDLVSYGSSFNVLDPQCALREAARALRSGGHWLALWNHRDLDDPLQRNVEAVIRRHLPTFDYGTRRQDPSAALEACGLFGSARHEQARFEVRIEAATWLDAWRSHATLQRQAGDAFETILRDFELLLDGQAHIEVPYHTRAWWARRNTRAT